MAELSLDRREFARLCAMEIQRAAKLAGTKMPDPDFVREMALDMASSHALSRVPCSRVAELFSMARAHYAETPLLRHLVRAWDNHMKSQAEATAPKDAPKLAPPPELAHSEAQMRHLAAVRTAIAEGRTFELCAREDWMEPYLAADPGEPEVRAWFMATTDSTRAWCARNKGHPPMWGYWMDFYGLLTTGN